MPIRCNNLSVLVAETIMLSRQNCLDSNVKAEKENFISIPKIEQKRIEIH